VPQGRKTPKPIETLVSITLCLGAGRPRTLSIHFCKSLLRHVNSIGSTEYNFSDICLAYVITRHWILKRKHTHISNDVMHNPGAHFFIITNLPPPGSNPLWLLRHVLTLYPPRPTQLGGHSPPLASLRRSGHLPRAALRWEDPDYEDGSHKC